MRRCDIRPTTDLPSASTKASLRFHYALVFQNTETRAHVRLLGPCFKTGRMEPQPNSSQTPAWTAEQECTGKRPAPVARDREPRGLKPHRTPQHSCPRSGSPGDPKGASTRPVHAQVKNCRGANNGSPEGLETDCTREHNPPQPAHRIKSRKGRRDVNRQGSTTPGPHESHLHSVPTGCNVLLEKPYERSHWHIDRHRQQQQATINPEGDHHSTVTRIQVTANSEHSEIFSFELRQFHSFTPERFHALLNSLFRVLFNFPSRYLFAIGLVVVFSLWWSLPPTLGCTLKQPDSRGRAAPTCRAPVLRALHPLWARGSRVRSNLDISVRKRGAKTTLP